MEFQVIFSSGKCVESIVLAILVDRGLINYDDKVSLHWPEFSKNDKDGITIEDVLRHESGLARFNDHVHQNKDILRENIKKNFIGRVIEDCKLDFPKSNDNVETKREYHGATRGFILNEIVRRVDAQRR